MQLAVVLHPRFHALDMAGPHEVLGRLAETETAVVAGVGGPATNDFGTLILNGRSIADLELAENADPSSPRSTPGRLHFFDSESGLAIDGPEDRASR